MIQSRMARAYIICSGPRTGSNLLAGALRQTGLAGRPFEYFARNEVDKVHTRQRLNLEKNVVFSKFSDWIDNILDAGTTDNGVFGVKLHRAQLPDILEAIGGQDADCDPLPSLRAFFPNLRLIWLRRENLVAQGVSYYRAVATGRWFLPSNGGHPAGAAPAFDFEKIDEWVRDATAQDEGWRHVLAGADDITLKLTYEQFTEDYEGTVRRVLDHLGLELGAKPFPRPEIAKQADDRSVELERLYIETKRARLGNGAARPAEPPSAPSAARPADPPPTTSVAAVRRRICIVTSEFLGLFRNGGIGTANTGLALALAADAFDVTVAFANSDERGVRSKVGDFEAVRASYAEQDITLDFVPQPAHLPGAFDDVRTASYSVFLYLRQKQFDVVLFSDNGALGFYALQAKRLGAYPSAPSMYVVAHGPFDWVLEINALTYDHYTISVSFMERRCVELADVLVSPSAYLLEWMRERRWALCRRQHVIQNLLPQPPFDAPRMHRTTHRRVTEIVFFGRQEIRKGLILFCDAIDGLQDVVGELRLTILGKFERIAGLHSGVYVAERSRRWRSPLRILTNFDQADALAYLRRPGVLAVIPSLAENSPCVVAECLEIGIDFLASMSGGTAELVAEEDRARCLFEPNAASLADAIRRNVEHGHRSPRPAIARETLRQQWISLLSSPVGSSPAAGPATATCDPLVSLCLVARQPSRTFVRSLLAQTYANIEIQLAGSEDSLAAWHGLETRVPLRFSLGEDRRAAARHAAARTAEGRYLLFVDEACVVLEHDAIARLVEAARRTDADIVTGFPDRTPDQKELSADRGAQNLPIGACPDLGAMENCFGEKLMLVSAAAFRAGKGFPSDCEETFLDWAFLATSALEGANIEVLPLPLYKLQNDDRHALLESAVIKGFRDVLRAYAAQPLAGQAKLVEWSWRRPERARRRLPSLLGNLGSEARAKALSLSALDPSSDEAAQSFLDYCCERRMADLAIDFAVVNCGKTPAEIVASMQAVAERDALDWVNQRQVLLPHSIDVTAALEGKFEAVESVRPGDVKTPSSALIEFPIGSRIGTLRADRGCPRATRAITARARIDGDAGAAAVGIAVVPPGAPLVFTETGPQAGEDAAWSGWVYADQWGGVELRLDLPLPASEALDLYVCSRPSDRGAADSTVTLLSMQVLVAIDRGAPRHDGTSDEAQFLPIDPAVMRTAILLTDVSDFPFDAVDATPRMLQTHPVPGKSLLIRLPEALPAGVAALRCVVSVDHEQCRPVDFGFWVCAPFEHPTTEARLMSLGAFSGWMTVSTPFDRQVLTVRFSPTRHAMDVYLTVRVTQAQDVHFCWARWHEFLVLRPQQPTDDDEPWIARHPKFREFGVNGGTPAAADVLRTYSGASAMVSLSDARLADLPPTVRWRQS